MGLITPTLPGEVRTRRRWWSTHAAVAVFLVAGALVTITRPYVYQAPDFPSLRSDGVGYHLWTRAIVDGHLDFCRYAPLSVGQAVTPPNESGRCGNIYPPGLALLRLPVMAPLTAANGGMARSPAEDLASDLLALLAGAVAVGTTAALARRLGATNGLAQLAAVAVTFGTGLFHYATLDGAFTHVYVAAGLGLFALLLVGEACPRAGPLHVTSRRRATRTAAWWLLPFLLLLVRQTTLLPLLCLGVATAWYLASRKGVAAVLREHRGPVLAAGSGVLCALLAQTLLNSWTAGSLQLSSYGEEYGFVAGSWLQVHVAFGLHKGAFPQYPVGAVALVVSLAARRWWVGGAALASTLVLVLLYGSWFSPFLGGGFGHRGFVDLAPLWGAALAVGLQRARGGWRVLALTVTGASTVFTLGLMIAYWQGDVVFYGIAPEELVRYGLWSESAPVRLVRWLTG